MRLVFVVGGGELGFEGFKVREFEYERVVDHLEIIVKFI